MISSALIVIKKSDVSKKQLYSVLKDNEYVSGLAVCGSQNKIYLYIMLNGPKTKQSIKNMIQRICQGTITILEAKSDDLKLFKGTTLQYNILKDQQADYYFCGIISDVSVEEIKNI